MRIALVGDRPPPYGGIAVHVETLAAGLSARGHEVEILDTSRVRSYPRFAAELASLTARGFLLHAHTSGHNPKSWALVGACGLARTRRRNVVSLHSGLLPGYLEGMPLRQRACRQALAPYGQVVAVSRAVTEALAACGVDRSRIVEQPAFSASSVRPGELPEPVRLAREKHTVLLTAALAPSPVYGARLLWAALSLLRKAMPEVGCVVFGPQTASARRDVEEAGLGDCVYGLGELAHAEALAAISVSDVFVRPTLTDGDAITVREALALGVRTVASDVALRPDGTRTFRSGDPFALAEAVEAAVAGPRPEAPRTDALATLLEIYQKLWGGDARAA